MLISGKTALQLNAEFQRVKAGDYDYIKSLINEPSNALTAIKEFIKGEIKYGNNR